MPTFNEIQQEIAGMLSIPDEELTPEQREAMDAVATYRLKNARISILTIPMLLNGAFCLNMLPCLKKASVSNNPPILI